MFYNVFDFIGLVAVLEGAESSVAKSAFGFALKKFFSVNSFRFVESLIESFVFIAPLFKARVHITGLFDEIGFRVADAFEPLKLPLRDVGNQT